VITENNGREMFIGKSSPWEIDSAGRLVLSLKEARELRDHLTWQGESTSEHVLIHGRTDEDG
jgi:hypothetical protein